MYNLIGGLKYYLGHLQQLHPFRVTWFFRPTLHVPLGCRVYVGSQSQLLQVLNVGLLVYNLSGGLKYYLGHLQLRCFRPALHVPLGCHADVVSFLGKTLGTILPAPGAARPAVMDWRIQVFFVSHSGRTGAGPFWGAGSGPCTGSCYNSSSSSAAGSVAPSMTAPACTVCLEGDDKIRVHRR